MEKKLSEITPDFEDLHRRLQIELAAKDSWKDVLPTSIGTAVLDLFAGVGTSYQYSAESGFLETFSETARRDSSVYAVTRMLGNRIARKQPSSVSASLTNTTDAIVSIVPYSTFYVNNIPFYNRTQIQLGQGQTGVNISLYEGLPETFVFDLAGIRPNSYYEFFLEKPGFVIADADVLVYTVHKTTKQVRTWKIVEDALWEYGPDQLVVYESTTGTGDVSLVFGDGQNGAQLDSQETLHVRSVIINRITGHLPDLPVVYNTSTGVSLQGQTTSPVHKGVDQKSPNYYKLYNGVIARSRRKAISKKALQATIITYPGVADATVLVQRDIAPYDLRWMNTVRVCVLPENSDTFGGTNPNPKTVRWQDLILHLSDKIHTALQIQTWNPVKIGVDVEVSIGVYPNVDTEKVKQDVLTNIMALFKKDIGTLGKRLALSDIVDKCTVKGTDYVKIIRPTEHIVPTDKLQYVALSKAPTINVFYSERVTDAEDSVPYAG